jgi:lysophospholipase L1-like esterase
MKKIISILLILLSSQLFAQQTPYWNHKVSMFKLMPNTEGEIIFLGDSITDRCEWFELFSNPSIKNRGLSGDKTSGVLDRLSEITESRPDKIFIMIGVNDLRHDVSIEEIMKNYQSILENINSDSPQTKIFIQSVIPVNELIGKPKTTSEEILKLNIQIENLASQFKIPFVNIFASLIDEDGYLNKKYSEDGLHINGDGYSVWKSIIEKYVNN